MKSAIRIRMVFKNTPQIIKTFVDLYKTDMDNLVTSFDGS